MPSIMASNIADGLTNKSSIKLEAIWLCHTLVLYTTDYYIVELSACVVHYIIVLRACGMQAEYVCICFTCDQGLVSQ